jgi:hypothetical protein
MDTHEQEIEERKSHHQHDSQEGRQHEQFGRPTVQTPPAGTCQRAADEKDR